METLRLILQIVVVVAPALAAAALIFVDKKLDDQAEREADAKISALSIEKDAAMRELRAKTEQLSNLALLNGDLDSKVRMGLVRFHFTSEIPRESLTDFQAIIEIDALEYRFLMTPAPYKTVIGNSAPALSFLNCFEPYSDGYKFTNWMGLNLDLENIKFFSCDLMFGIMRSPHKPVLRDFHQTYLKIYMRKSYVSRIEKFDLLLNNWIISEVKGTDIEWTPVMPNALPLEFPKDDWLVMHITRYDGFPFPGAIIDLFNGTPRKFMNLRN